MTDQHRTQASDSFPAADAPRHKTRAGVGVPLAIGAAVLVVLALGASLFVRARASTNKVALDREPKGVTVVTTRAAQYRRVARYVGTIEPWTEARLGPQFTSAYVDTVLVRPGAKVKRNQVLATLDCRNSSAQNKAVAMQARALETEQQAMAHQAARVSGLLDGGFVSPDEAEQKTAESVSKQAELLAANAKLLRTSLEVSDCILRAPFEGEVSERSLDPGAFARPGASVVSVVDRKILRISAEVPEADFAAVAPGTPVRIQMLATAEKRSGEIARRSPAADPSTRTVHFEIDLPDPEHSVPVHTTAELAIEVGQPVPATELPLMAASVRGKQASVFVVEGTTAKKRVVPVLGESSGKLFVAPTLAAGARIVSEGRALLRDGDRVLAKLDGPSGMLQ